MAKALVHETDKMVKDGRDQAEGHDVFASASFTLGSVDFPVTHIAPDIDPCRTDLSYFRASIGDFEPLQRGRFAVVKKIASGINGDVLKCIWQRNDSETQCVAVKKLRNSCLSHWSGADPNERKIHFNLSAKEPGSEDSLTEIGVLTYLRSQPERPPYLVQMLGVYADHSFTWLVSEFADGGDLFELVASESLSETQVRRFTWQLLQAVVYLHRHNIGHRDISLENILIKDGIAQLMDFGSAVQTCSTSGVPLRYFRSVGKDNNRAPEVYVPKTAKIKAVAPPALAPDRVALVRLQGWYVCEVRFPEEAKPGQPCVVDVWGYRVTPADVFSSGVCLFTMACNCPPWERAQPKDPSFSFVCDRGDTGIMELMQYWDKTLLGPESTKMLNEMLRLDSSQRPSAVECLMNPWFADLEPEETT